MLSLYTYINNRPQHGIEGEEDSESRNKSSLAVVGSFVWCNPIRRGEASSSSFVAMADLGFRARFGHRAESELCHPKFPVNSSPGALGRRHPSCESNPISEIGNYGARSG